MENGTGFRTLSRKLIAAGIHLYTSFGLILAFVAALATINGDIRTFLVALLLSVVVDATDGALARRFDVKAAVPQLDGRRLDDIIDYITFVFLPCLGLVAFQVLTGPFAIFAVAAMIVSALGFSREDAKLDEAFIGFPSYWNLVFIYLYVLPVPNAVAAFVIFILAILVIVPIQYLYLTKTRWLKRTNLALTVAYGAMIAPVCFFPDAGWAKSVIWISLFYPVYYAAASLWFHFRIAKRI